jgi:hypothetical protein
VRAHAGGRVYFAAACACVCAGCPCCQGVCVRVKLLAPHRCPPPPTHTRTDTPVRARGWLGWRWSRLLRSP